MIKFEHTEVTGWKKAIFKMRETDGSLEESDSGPGCSVDFIERKCSDCDRHEFCKQSILLHSHYVIGPNDLDMMRELSSKSKGNTNFMDSILVTVNITAPLYWWNDRLLYYHGAIADVDILKYAIVDKEFSLEDFSHDHMIHPARIDLGHTIDALNFFRGIYLHGGMVKDENGNLCGYGEKSKQIWWQILQLLPSSYNLTRIETFDYNDLAYIYKNKKYETDNIDEWCEHKEMLYITDREDSKRESFKGQYGFCDWIKTLPYSELITGRENNE